GTLVMPDAADYSLIIPRSTLSSRFKTRRPWSPRFIYEDTIPRSPHCVGFEAQGIETGLPAGHQPGQLVLLGGFYRGVWGTDCLAAWDNCGYRRPLRSPTPGRNRRRRDRTGRGFI